MRSLKKAFTLMEVNLAIFIMAGGVLAMVSLYSLGMRESRQSTEDVAAAGYADAVFAPLVTKLSSTELTWDGWVSAVNQSQPGEGEKVCDGVLPAGGWGAYVQKVGSEQSGLFRIDSGCNSKAKGVFDAIIGAPTKTAYGGTVANGASWPLPMDESYFYGLVATRKGSTVSLAFRASRRRDGLMSQPVYYTEVHFQGRDNP